MSDNGPQYISDEFKQFAANYGFEHVTSSPMYPRSNGFSERMVQTVKHLFTKARESGQDPHLAMLCLRTTPIDHHTPSPCKILNGRRYRSNLPIVGTKETSVADYTDNLQRAKICTSVIMIVVLSMWESESLLTALHTPLQFTYLLFSYLILSPKLFLSTKSPISSL